MTAGNLPIRDAEALKYVAQTLGYPLESLCLFPKYFLIETINICNARCIMCGIDFDNKKKAAISDELFNKITKELSRYRDYVEKVMLYLDCEPLLDKELHLKIQKMKSAGVKKVNIATNASLLEQEKTTQIINAGLDEIYITIDSLKKDTFEAIRRGLSFETVYQNIIEFIRLRNQLNPNLRIRIQMILQKLNLGESGTFVKHWTPLLKRSDQVVVQKAHNWASAVEILKFGDENRVNDIPCIALWGTFCIHANGDVGLCCMDSNSSILLGNLNRETIAQIWSGENLAAIRQRHISGARNKIPLCNGCTLWRESKHQAKEIIGVG